MKWGLNVKFICYTVFIVVFISLVFSAVFIFQSRKALLHEFHNTAESLVQNLALNIEVPLFIENSQALTELAQNLLKEDAVQSVRIVNQKNKVFVALSKQRRLMPWEKEMIITPVYFSAEREGAMTEDMKLFYQGNGSGEGARNTPSGQLIGRIEVLFSRQSIIAALDRMRLWIFIAATIAAFIGGIGALYFSRTLILPVQRLARATYSIARGNWQEHLEVGRTDELGKLTASFNIMAESLTAKKEQLEHTYKELAQKEKMAEIGKFSMIIAHELKNPLGIIKGSVDILNKQETEPHLKETMIHYIQDEVKRLNKLIDDFLSFARPAPPQKTPSDVNSIVKRIADHFNVPEGLHKRICLRTDLGAEVPAALDDNQIYQVLLNLVNNAVQAIEHEGEIHIATASDGHQVAIRIHDTGRGIPEDLCEKVFEPFFTTKAQGTGLGLAIVKKIIESHQGTIDISSAPGNGTTITIVLPV